MPGLLVHLAANACALVALGGAAAGQSATGIAWYDSLMRREVLGRVLIAAVVGATLSACGGRGVSRIQDPSGASDNSSSGYFKAKCKSDVGDCMQDAQRQCGGVYSVIHQESHAGGSLADLLPGPVTWYTVTFRCGAETAERIAAPERAEVAPNAVSSPPGIAVSAFPKSVAGYSFGLTGEQFVGACLNAGGTPLYADHEGASCTSAAVPVDIDVGFAVTRVDVLFCAGTICEVSLAGDADPKTAKQVVARFEDKYGAAGDPGPATQCDAAWQDSRFRRAWFWGRGQPRPTSSVMIVYGCAGTSAPSLSVFYYDQRGVQRRTGEYNERSGNW